jgi:HK97 family phage major capsid protein
MAYNNITSRTDAQALVPEEVVNDMVSRATTESAVLQMFRRVPVLRNQVRFPILSALPVAYWVGGDTGLKQTTEVNWSNKYLNIEEIATIMPVPDAVAADVDMNIWDSSMPYLVEAVGRTLDSAVFFGVNAPSSFPTNLSAAANSAGNSVNEGSTAAQGGTFGDIDAAIALVEADGFDVNGFVAARSLRGKLRASRSTQGERLDQNRVSGNLSELDGDPIAYPMRGLWPSGGGSNTNVRLFAGDFSQFVVGVRQDVSVTVSQDAVIQDNTGAIVYNAFQQDLTFLRLTFRIGWQVSNLINYDAPVESTRYPIARLMY